MPIIECSYCGDEFYSMYSCEEHERHCICNPTTKEFEVAEQMRAKGMGYPEIQSEFERDQLKLRKWIENVRPIEMGVKAWQS